MPPSAGTAGRPRPAGSRRGLRQPGPRPRRPSLAPASRRRAPRAEERRLRRSPPTSPRWPSLGCAGPRAGERTPRARSSCSSCAGGTSRLRRWRARAGETGREPRSAPPRARARRASPPPERRDIPASAGEREARREAAPEPAERSRCPGVPSPCRSGCQTTSRPAPRAPPRDTERARGSTQRQIRSSPLASDHFPSGQPSGRRRLRKLTTVTSMRKVAADTTAPRRNPGGTYLRVTT